MQCGASRAPDPGAKATAIWIDSFGCTFQTTPGMQHGTSLAKGDAHAYATPKVNGRVLHHTSAVRVLQQAMMYNQSTKSSSIG